MSKILKRPACLLSAAVGILLVCGIIWLTGFVVLGMPQADQRLGSPNPHLNPFMRTLLSVYLLANESALDKPAGEADVSLDLEVFEGELASDVIDRLTESSVVHNGFLLRNYLRYRGLDYSVEAGHYQLTGQMTVRQIAEALQTASPASIAFTVLEGWRTEEIAERIAVSGLNISFEDFLATCDEVSRSNDLPVEWPADPSLEGFLFPDTYFLDPESSARDVILAMLDNFKTRLDAETLAGFEQQGLSVYQAVTLASIVEREAVIPDERPLIASVFLRRLSLGMKLEADPTVQYALGLQADGWWKAPLSLSDLEVDSPYNTYRYAGLPPGPIANPGASALNAVAFPADSTYLYFRALCDGSGRHAFAETYEEHLENACP
jgi:UPF0755 protein